MIKMSQFIAAILLASVSVAHAETSGQPVQPASQGAASVEKNLTSTSLAAKPTKALPPLKKTSLRNTKSPRKVEPRASKARQRKLNML